MARAAFHLVHLNLPLFFTFPMILGATVDAAPLPVAIYSKASLSYEREIKPDGTPAREYYAIGYGG